MVEDSIQRLQEIGTSDRLTDHVGFLILPGRVTTAVRNKSVRRAPSILEFCSALLCVRNHSGNHSYQAVIPRCDGDNWILDIRAMAAALNHQRPGGHGYSNGQESQNRNQNSLAHRDVWCWPADHSVTSK